MRRHHFSLVAAAVGALCGVAALGPLTVHAAGEVTVSPTSLSFPATYVGDESTIAVTVTNVSGGSVTPSYSGGAPLDPVNFGGSQNCAGVTLPAGGTCTFTYRFTPASAGPHSSSTTIGVDGENFAISLSGTGLFPISLSQTTLSFPDTLVGSTSSIDIVVRNDSPVSQSPNYSGGAPLDPTHFGGSQNCAGVVLPSGGTCKFTYEFTPTSTGPHLTSTTIGIDGESFAISLSGNGTNTTTTTTSTTTPTTTTTTTTTPTTAPTTTPTTSSSTTTSVVAPPGTIVLVPGPLSDGGDAHVIAQGIVDFPEGSFGWEGDVLDLAAGPFAFEQSPPMFLAATSPAPLLVRNDGQSSALLDDGEAAFVAAGSTGDVGAVVPGPGAAALRITFVPSTDSFSFSPGPGRRDVNLVAATLQPGDRLHVVSPFPVLVAVVDGVVHDAPENTEVTGGSARSFNDADLSNSGEVPAVVLVAALGSPVP